MILLKKVGLVGIGSEMLFVIVSSTTNVLVGREQMNELCVYQVKEGKIVKEQFFY